METTAVPTEKQRAEWKRNLSFIYFDDPNPKFGTKFKHKGETFTIIGRNRSKVRPIVVENDGGQVFYVPLNAVKTVK